MNKKLQTINDIQGYRSVVEAHMKATLDKWSAESIEVSGKTILQADAAGPPLEYSE